jgi:hypothetical protein
MVMIVKDHEKQAHGFISVTRYARYPAHLRTVIFGHGAWPRAQLAAVDAGPWVVPRPEVRKARTLALGLHCSEQ